jgi:hypothetical protein
MDMATKNEIKRIALGYPLELKISNVFMRVYLAPAYLRLRKKCPGVSFNDFIDEMIQARTEARKLPFYQNQPGLRKDDSA